MGTSHKQAVLTGFVVGALYAGTVAIGGGFVTRSLAATPVPHLRPSPAAIRAAQEPLAHLLVIDMTGEGPGVIPIERSVAYFDVTGNGSARKTAWIKSGSGILVVDKSGRGKVRGLSQTFGDTTSDGTGFAALRLLDTNNDGILDERDPAFRTLRVWSDKNEDGVADPGEMHTLAEAGIHQISFSNGNVDVGMDDGTSRKVVDVPLANTEDDVRQVVSAPTD